MASGASSRKSSDGRFRLRKLVHLTKLTDKTLRTSCDVQNVDAASTPSGPAIEAFESLLDDLETEERRLAFDHEISEQATELELEATRLVKLVKRYDQEKIYGPSWCESGAPRGKRSEGEHFLGNVDTINQTELFKVARRLPKGAHLHIHFNSCLPASFLIRQARDVDAMYIRSSLPLTSKFNIHNAKVSFSVLTEDEVVADRPLERSWLRSASWDLWSPSYVPMHWMPYSRFREKCRFSDEDGIKYRGTEGAEAWLAKKLVFQEEEAHCCRQTGHGIWEKFNHRTQMMKGLFAYESAYRSYTRACIRDFVRDNIQYAEIRPNFMASNSLRSDDGKQMIGNEGIMAIIREELQGTMTELASEGKYFAGLKVIYCAPRSFSRELIAAALNECIELKRKFPELICGFDLVGHEARGNTLRHFLPELLAFQETCAVQGFDIPFLFHCGETLTHGGPVDGNLFSAVLLNTKRIGHGYALLRHPLLLKKFKEKNIAIECCPISNEVLGLASPPAAHVLSGLLANGVHCTINSDNGTLYRSTLSHDFYQTMTASDSMTLLGWKQLCLWSLEHSCLDASAAERPAVRAEWQSRWDDFCAWIVREYRPLEESWTPVEPPMSPV